MNRPSETDAAQPFAVECPGCHAPIAVAGDLAGHTAACPLCTAVFLVRVPVNDEPALPDERLLFAEPPPPSTRRRADEKLPITTAVETAPTSAADDEYVRVPPPTPDAGVPRELAFHEPVKTIRSGGAEIELRRLTPEERRARRARRNLLMLVIGAAILVALVVTLGKTGR